MRKPKEKAQTDSTTQFRNRAVVVYPGAFLLHAMMVYGLYRPLTQASLILVLVALALGIAIRMMRRETTLQALLVFLSGFLMLYVFGILSPMCFFAVTGRRDWIGWSALISTSLLLIVLWWRIRETYRIHWSAPLEDTPGVVLDPSSGMLARYPVEEPANTFSMVLVWSLVALIVLFVVLRLTGNKSGFLFLAVWSMPTLLGLIGTEVVGRGIAYYWVARRWELEHGVKLRVPPLR